MISCAGRAAADVSPTFVLKLTLPDTVDENNADDRLGSAAGE
ncbi:hypothetical protein [Candidatus Poriferisodalis sp.]